MPQSLAKNLIHLGFRTSNREPVLVDPVRARLSAYAAGVLRDLDSPAIAIHAWRDHRHGLLRLSQNHALSQVVMEVTRATSKWLKTKGAELANFHWQAGSAPTAGTRRGTPETELVYKAGDGGVRRLRPLRHWRH